MIEQIGLYFSIEGRTKISYLLSLLVAGAIGSVFEAIGFSLIFPLISIISDQGFIQKSEKLTYVYHALNFSSEKSFAVFLAMAVGAIFVIKSVFMIALYYAQAFLIAKWQAELASRLFRMYVSAPYSMFLSRNSSELIRNIGITSNFYGGFVLSLINFVIDLSVALAIVSVLIYSSPIATLLISMMLLMVVLVQFRYTGRLLRRIGADSTDLMAKLQKCMYQALGIVKETRIMGRESFFSALFDGLQFRMARNNRHTQFINRLPVAINEVLLVVVVVATLLIVLEVSGGRGAAIGTLGLMGAAAIRLIPLVNRMLFSLNCVERYRSAVVILKEDVVQLNAGHAPIDLRCPEVIPFRNELVLDRVSFSYEGSKGVAVDNVSLRVGKGEFIGLIGRSGSGKTTLADIVLGLHTPTSGTISVDGVQLPLLAKSQKRIQAGYVPQNIYIIDDTITRNVALGLQDDEIDPDRVKKAIQMAQMSEFVSTLPEGMETVLGERGARISAGQRQRIGIARSLYHDPDLLVLDEATSSLDPETEHAITQTIQSLRGVKTLIVIAHRLNTLKSCDRILFMRKGRVVDSGQYGRLVETNPEFARFVQLGKL